MKSRSEAALLAVNAIIGKHVDRVEQHAVPLSWQFPDQGALHFLSPGKQNNGDYQMTLSALNWDNFYEKLHGAQFL